MTSSFDDMLSDLQAAREAVAARPVPERKEKGRLFDRLGLARFYKSAASPGQEEDRIAAREDTVRLTAGEAALQTLQEDHPFRTMHAKAARLLVMADVTRRNIESFSRSEPNSDMLLKPARERLRKMFDELGEEPLLPIADALRDGVNTALGNLASAAAPETRKDVAQKALRKIVQVRDDLRAFDRSILTDAIIYRAARDPAFDKVAKALAPAPAPAQASAGSAASVPDNSP